MNLIKPETPGQPPAAHPVATLPAPQSHGVIRMGFDTVNGFEALQRAAKLLTNSTLVPAAYRATITKGYGERAREEANPNGLSNCVVALNMSQRMGMDPLMVMQNLYIVEGKPGWSSQFIIAAINQCGRFSPLRFEMSPKGPEQDVTYTYSEWDPGANKKVQKTGKVRIQNQTCRAWAIEKATGERVESAEVSMVMAVQEGWYTKNGSKWQTMQEVMLRYRCASFFGKVYAPELLMGYQTKEEVEDYIDLEPLPAAPAPIPAAGPVPTSLEGLKAQHSAPAADPAPEVKGPQADPPPAAPAAPAPVADAPKAPAAQAAPAAQVPPPAATGVEPMGKTHRDSLRRHGQLMGISEDVIARAEAAMDVAPKIERRAFFDNLTAGDKGVFDPYYPQAQPPADGGLGLGEEA